MVIAAVLTQPAPLSCDTVYVVVVSGEAATGFDVVEFKPAAGDHKKVPPDTTVPAPSIAVNLAGSPAHTVVPTSDTIYIANPPGITVTVATDELTAAQPEACTTARK